MNRTGRKSFVTRNSRGSATYTGLLRTRGPPKSKIPVSTAQVPTSSGRVQTPGLKIKEPVSSVEASSSILKTRGPVSKANKPLTWDRSSPSRRPAQSPTKPLCSVINNGVNSFTRSGPAQIAEPRVSESASSARASKSPGPVLTGGPTTSELESSDRAFISQQGPLSKTSELISSERTSTSPNPRAPSFYVSKNEDTKRTNKSLIPIINPHGRKAPSSLQERHAKILPGSAILKEKQDHKDGKMKPEISQKLSPKRARSASPGRKFQRTPTTRDTQLVDELDKRNRTISELKVKLLDSENVASEQELRLAESKSVQRAKDAAIEQLQLELLTAKQDFEDMRLRLQQADLGLEEMNKSLERTAYLESELKEARDIMVNQQQQNDSASNVVRELQELLKDANTKAEIHCQAEAQLRKDADKMQVQLERQAQELSAGSIKIQSMQQTEQDLRANLEKRDSIIKKVTNDLAVRDEEFRNLFETLKNKHTQLRTLEHTNKMLEERHERDCSTLAKLEERNAVLQDKNVHLKQNQRYYSQIIIGNDGKPFFEQISINPDVANDFSPSQKKESQQNQRREN